LLHQVHSNLLWQHDCPDNGFAVKLTYSNAKEIRYGALNALALGSPSPLCAYGLAIWFATIQLGATEHNEKLDDDYCLSRSELNIKFTQCRGLPPQLARRSAGN
jgi:hypothetical protein